MTGERVEVTTPHGPVLVRFQSERNGEPAELHVVGEALKLGRYTYRLTCHLYAPEGRWSLRFGSSRVTRDGAEAVMTPAGTDALHDDIVPALVAWVTTDSPQRRRALVLWLEERAEECVREADRLEEQAADVRSHGGSFFERALQLRQQLEPQG